jgi:hypothetical protein
MKAEERRCEESSMRFRQEGNDRDIILLNSIPFNAMQFYCIECNAIQLCSPSLLGAPPVAMRICFEEYSLPSTTTVPAPLKLAAPRILVTCSDNQCRGTGTVIHSPKRESFRHEKFMLR